jgi:hypothetical protein
MPFPSRTLLCAERIQTNFKLGSTTACVGNVQQNTEQTQEFRELARVSGNCLKLETPAARTSSGEKNGRPKDDAL